MSVSTLSAQHSTSALSLTENAWTDLLSATVTGTGDLVEIKANVDGLDANQVQTRIVIDGTEVLSSEGSAGSLVLIVEPLSAGSHTVEFQAYSFISGQSAGERFMTILNLI